MLRPAILNLLLLSSCLALPAWGAEAAEERVYFHDPRVEAAIRDVLGEPDAILTRGMVASITELDLSGKGVQSIDGLQACTGLKRLNLAGALRPARWSMSSGSGCAIPPPPPTPQPFRDAGSWPPESHNFDAVRFEPLLQLANLEVLDLRHTMLTYPDFLAGCPKLVELKLTNNPIADLTGLAGLTQLERLDVTLQPAVSGSVSLTPLSALSRLESLVLDGGAVSDLIVLEQLKVYGRLTDVQFWSGASEDE